MSPSASKPVPGPEAVEPEAAQTMTVETSKDLAALVSAVQDSGLSKDFVATHQGKGMEFDGISAAMNQHGRYNTRYDILIFAGDSIESGATGPNFKLTDVNVSDLHLTGSSIPDTPGIGQKLRITAEVESYDESSDLLLLEPVSSEVRQ